PSGHLLPASGAKDLAQESLSREGCAIIDEGHRRAMNLSLEMPRSPLETVMSHEVWEEYYDRLTHLITEHRTTLVFVNTPRIAASHCNFSTAGRAIGSHRLRNAERTDLPPLAR